MARKIKVRNRVYHPIYGYGTVIEVHERNSFTVRFDKADERNFHNGAFDADSEVNKYPLEWRQGHCLFCYLIGEGQPPTRTGVFKVEGTGKIPHKRHYFKLVDENGDEVMDRIVMTTVKGGPCFFRLSHLFTSDLRTVYFRGKPVSYVPLDDDDEEGDD